MRAKLLASCTFDVPSCPLCPVSKACLPTTCKAHVSCLILLLVTSLHTPVQCPELQQTDQAVTI